MSSTKNNHERKVNKTHSWDRIHGSMSNPKSKRVNLKTIDIEELINVFLGTAQSMSPATDVLNRIKKKYECSNYMTGQIYDIGLKYVKQQWDLVGMTSKGLWKRKENDRSNGTTN